ncbi:MAG: cupredoxin domain-containing protein [Candidatus Pacebacteria bacterium]|nr:cupredoxin domain-containing protein [Candidatus Paceibacterota bacterium]
MNKTASIIITIALVIGLGIVFIGGSKTKNSDTSSTQQVQNVEVRDGIQYITIDAKGGYFPEVSTAKADIPTKLIVKTNGTYDCSASLVIRPIGFQKILTQTGEETIDIGIPKAGEPLQGVCGMGMYNFEIDFS